MGNVLINKICDSFKIWIEFTGFSVVVIKTSFLPPYRFKDIVHHLYFVAYKSAPIVFVIVAFAASVIIMESSYHMKLIIQDDSTVPAFAAVMIFKEIGSLITCLMLGSRVGAGWAAEISLMKNSEQIDALKLLGIDPIEYLAAPRFIAAVIGAFILSGMANIICLFTAIVITTTNLGHSLNSFISLMNVFIKPIDLFYASLRGGFFGGIIPLIAVFFGFRTGGGAEGVGVATTNALVYITISIIVMDFVFNLLFA